MAEFSRQIPRQSLQAEQVAQRKAALPDGRATARVGKLLDARPLQRAAKPNNTGLPDTLKSGIESLSGMSMDSVNVHYNSSKPAQLNAHAYTQGTDIHVAPNQEKHLPHEAWHVVQQAQGRVRPTMQMQAGAHADVDTAVAVKAGGARALNGDVRQPKSMTDDGGAQAVIQRLVINIAPKEKELGQENLRDRRFNDDRLFAEKQDYSNHHGRFVTPTGKIPRYEPPKPKSTGFFSGVFASGPTPEQQKKALHSESRQANLFEVNFSAVGETEPVIFAGHGIVEKVPSPVSKELTEVAGSQQGYDAEDFFAALTAPSTGLPRGYRGVVYLQGCRTANGVKENFSDTLAFKLYSMLRQVFPAIIVKGNTGNSVSRHALVSSGLMVHTKGDGDDKHQRHMQEKHREQYPDYSHHFLALLTKQEVLRRMIINEKRNALRRLAGIEEQMDEDDLLEEITEFSIVSMDRSSHYSDIHSKYVMSGVKKIVTDFDRAKSTLGLLKTSLDRDNEGALLLRASNLLSPVIQEGDVDKEDKLALAESAQKHVAELKEEAEKNVTLDEEMVGSFFHDHGAEVKHLFASTADFRGEDRLALHAGFTEEQKKKLAQVNILKLRALEPKVEAALEKMDEGAFILESLEREQEKIKDKCTELLERYRFFKKLESDRRGGMLHFFDFNEVTKAHDQARSPELYRQGKRGIYSTASVVQDFKKADVEKIMSGARGPFFDSQGTPIEFTGRVSESAFYFISPLF